MNIKKIITGLILSMLLSSGVANADWGDVYYCQMASFSGITVDGEKKNYKLEKFKFKLDPTKRSMVFGDDGFFEDFSIELTETRSWPHIESWYAHLTDWVLYFDEGRFLLSDNGSNGLRSMYANCDKF